MKLKNQNLIRIMLQLKINKSKSDALETAKKIQRTKRKVAKEKEEKYI